jgi:hypothetical protein
MLMSLHHKYVKILSGILPVGAAGVSLLLGSTMPSAAHEHPGTSQPLASDKDAVAQRLAAIREAVSAVADPAEKETKPADSNLHLAWGNWWNNGGWGGWGRPWGGWGWPNWNNWRNWNNWNNWWRNW